MTRRLLSRTTTIFLAAVALAACASAPQRETQWIDPAIGTQSRILQGSRVLVACEAYDVSMRRVCEDQLARALAAKGAIPVMMPPGVSLLNDRGLDEQLVAVAMSVSAKAILVMTLTPATRSGGSGASVGLGAFSFGGGGGLGLGLGVPVGGGGESTGFAANGRVTDVASNRLVWTATFVSPPSADLSAQFGGLSGAMLDAAQGAGLL